MKTRVVRKGIGACLILWILFLPFLGDANAQQEPISSSGTMTMPMRGLGGPGRIETRSLEAMLYVWQSYLFLERHALGLTGDQMDKIESILNDQEKFFARKNAERRLLLVDIRQLLFKEPIELNKVETQVRALEALNVEIITAEIETLEKALAALTVEQRKELLAIFKESRFTGPFGP